MSMNIVDPAIYKADNLTYSKHFCKAFVQSDKPKYIFGVNAYADSIAAHIDVHGYIDEYTNKTNHKGRPICKPGEIDASALVVGAVIIGKPILVENKVSTYPFSYLDYFSFYRDSGLALEPVMFWPGFKEDFATNRYQYEKIFSLLEDGESRTTFESIINFRLTYDLSFMKNFTEREDEQYFESFLSLHPRGESFVDIGGFDGFTTEEFIRYCPDYERVYFFEPEKKNMLVSQKRLANNKAITYFKIGLANNRGEARFNTGGSASKIDEQGDLAIKTDRLDDLIEHEVTFMKMDIEGAEIEAIKGAQDIIQKYHPRLAISVYHRPDDFWKIPELILSIVPDYRLYMRHYTTGIAETVMFFMPNRYS